MKNDRIKILQIITESPQTLDYTLPLFFNLKDKNNYDVVILYCCLNRKRLTKDSVYLKDIDKLFNVKSYDLSSFSNFPTSIFINIVRPILGASLANSLSTKNFILGIEIFGVKGLANLFTAFKKKIEDFIVRHTLEPAKLINTINPDIIFFDNRSKFKNLASEYIAKQIIKSKYKIKIIPHAPHGISSDDEFIPILTNHYPKNVEYWSSLKTAIPLWEKDSKILSEYRHVGLPPLDNHWYKFILQKRKLLRNKQYLTILYIPQKIREKGDRGLIPQFDLIDYEMELKNISKIVTDIDSQCIPFKLVIKPHPKISMNTIKSLIYELDHSSISCSFEPLFYQIEHSNFVISEFSTAAILCACFIPILIVDSKLECDVRNSWNVLDNLYGGINLRYNIDNLKITMGMCKESIEKKMVNNNRRHLESHFGDDSIKNIMQSIQTFL